MVSRAQRRTWCCSPRLAGSRGRPDNLALLHLRRLERRRSRHPPPAAGQGGVREVGVSRSRVDPSAFWWRRREFNPRPTLKNRKLFIFQTARTAENARTANRGYAAGTRDRCELRVRHRQGPPPNQELSHWLGRESGTAQPVHVAAAGEPDLTANLKATPPDSCPGTTVSQSFCWSNSLPRLASCRV
jgi:hypothetical protein